MKTETIAAIATAMTNAGIGIIRISGEEAFQVIDRVYRSKKGDKRLSQAESHTVHYGYICDGENVVDEVMVLALRAPNTYTREDTIEIDCHGGTLVMRRILERFRYPVTLSWPVMTGFIILIPCIHGKGIFLEGQLIV